MNEIVVAKLLDLAFDALAVGLERDAIVSQVKEMEAKGATPKEVAEALKGMRDKAIADAQAAIGPGT